MALNQQPSLDNEDMDPESRALIEAMLAEEEHYFGHGSIEVSGTGRGGQKKTATKNPNSSIGRRWSNKEDSLLFIGLEKQVASNTKKNIVPPYPILPTVQIKDLDRTSKQIHSRIKAIYKNGISSNNALNKKFKNILPLFGLGQLDKSSDLVKKQFFDQEKVFIHKSSIGDGNNKINEGEEEEDDISLGGSDIDILNDSRNNSESEQATDDKSKVLDLKKSLSNAIKKVNLSELKDESNTKKNISNSTIESNVNIPKKNSVKKEVIDGNKSFDSRDDVPITKETSENINKESTSPISESHSKSLDPNSIMNTSNSVPKHYTEVAEESDILSLVKTVNKQSDGEEIKNNFGNGIKKESTELNDTPKTETKSAAFDLDGITKEEVQSLPEWFYSTICLARGERPHPRTLRKTPEKYKAIRNFIINAWWTSMPKYVSKSSIRPGLKGYGDVNALSRVHEYLERVGLINVNTSKRKQPDTSTKKSNKKESVEFDDILSRPKRPRTMYDPSAETSSATKKSKKSDKILKGHDIDDLLCMDDNSYLTAAGMSQEDLEAAREAARMFLKNAKWFDDSELEKFNPKILELRNKDKDNESSENDFLGGYDPFKLIPCKKYTNTAPAPFSVSIESNCMILMDFHSHLMNTEVIGLLGGNFDGEKLIVKDVFCCDSISTGVQCEMDPASEMQARDYFSSKGYKVVGWYHSHPTFAPNPSIRDIENQSQYQQLFRHDTGVEPFIGVIVSPYDPKYVVLEEKSQFGVLTISYDFNSLNEYRLPFSCMYDTISSNGIGLDLINQMKTLITKYSNNSQRLNLQKRIKGADSLTRLEKLVKSISIFAAYSAKTEDELNSFTITVKDMLLDF